MANWDNPQLTTQYDVFLAECKERDVDAITLCLNNPTTPPVGAVKMVRLGAGQVKLQEFGGSIFSDVVLNVAGGGTGGSTAAAARTALGIGTMGIQNANAVAITGGSITGITALTLSTSVTPTADNTYDVGSFALQFRKGYFKSALVLPVGVDKYATS
jgi:hypothetical protein